MRNQSTQVGALKRKGSAHEFQRRVHARREEDGDAESAASDLMSNEISPATAQPHASDSDTGSDASQETASYIAQQSKTDEDQLKADLSSITFGALLRAENSLSDSPRRCKEENQGSASRSNDHKRTSRGASKIDPANAPKRSSKHAPQEQSSKRPVSRRREIIADTRPKYRDPRFDPVVGHGDPARSRTAYAFLDEYRDSEMAELRAQIKRTKDSDQKETLKRQLLSMESRKKARQRKEEEEALLLEHRRQEKELVAQGKQPYYLKKSEQRRQLLTKRYQNMSQGQMDKDIARKRKKVAGKEKKELGSLQRTAHVQHSRQSRHDQDRSQS